MLQLSYTVHSAAIFVDGHKNARLFNSLYIGTAPVLYLRREALMSIGEISTSSQEEHPERLTKLTVPARADFAVSDELVKAIGADIFALKMLLPALLSRVGRLDPILGSAIQQGFQDASDQIEHMITDCRWIETRDRCSNACQHQETTRRRAYRVEQRASRWLTGLSVPLVAEMSL
jgi:hypothetical protein